MLCSSQFGDVSDANFRESLLATSGLKVKYNRRSYITVAQHGFPLGEGTVYHPHLPLVIREVKYRLSDADIVTELTWLHLLTLAPGCWLLELVISKGCARCHIRSDTRAIPVSWPILGQHSQWDEDLAALSLASKLTRDRYCLG